MKLKALKPVSIVLIVLVAFRFFALLVAGIAGLGKISDSHVFAPLAFSFLYLISLIGIVTREKWGAILVMLMSSLLLGTNILDLFSKNLDPLRSFVEILLEVLIIFIAFKLKRQYK